MGLGGPPPLAFWRLACLSSSMGTGSLMVSLVHSPSSYTLVHQAQPGSSSPPLWTPIAIPAPLFSLTWFTKRDLAPIGSTTTPFLRTWPEGGFGLGCRSASSPPPFRPLPPLERTRLRDLTASTSSGPIRTCMVPSHRDPPWCTPMLISTPF